MSLNKEVQDASPTAGPLAGVGHLSRPSPILYPGRRQGLWLRRRRNCSPYPYPG